LRSGQAHHAERVDQPDEAGEDRHQQRHLKGERPRVGVDADDLVLDSLGLAGEQLVELGVAHSCASSSSAGRRCCCSAGAARCSPRHVGEGDREGRQHDGAGERQPERQPERPAAEFTPAASLTRSSEIGASV
jgi:hypothetical protein